MKEHPDYKYRPRRKPKSLVKKENKFGFSISPLISPGDGLANLPRGLLPPLAPPTHHPLLPHEDLKIPRFFPPFPYPLYPLQHKLSDDFNGGKLAADLALQALYGSGTFYPSHQAMAWPTTGLSTAAACLQPNCSCPSPPKEPKRPFPPSKIDDPPFPSPARADDDAVVAEREESRYRKLDEDGFPASSLERHHHHHHHQHQEESRSQDRFSSSSSSSPPTEQPAEKLSATTTTTTSASSASGRVDSAFSVQSLTSNSSSSSGSQRGHVI